MIAHLSYEMQSHSTSLTRACRQADLKPAPHNQCSISHQHNWVVHSCPVRHAVQQAALQALQVRQLDEQVAGAQAAHVRLAARGLLLHVPLEGSIHRQLQGCARRAGWLCVCGGWDGEGLLAGEGCRVAKCCS